MALKQVAQGWWIDGTFHTRKHEYRPWAGSLPRPTPTACGDCGRPKDEHDSPRAYILVEE